MGTTNRAAVALALLLAGPLSGQERTIEEENLPPDVGDRVISFFNDTATARIEGGGRIPSGSTLEGDVAVLGSLSLGGTVAGDLAVVNGDLLLLPSARVTGNVTVVGGTLEGGAAADIGGTLATYDQRLRFARTEGRLERIEAGERSDEGFSPSLGFGRSRFTIRAGTNYNRVEGLPVMFGPIIETASSNPFRLEALAVWRTVDGFTLDDLGYRITLEQYLGGRQIFSIGASAHSLVEPIERWTLTDLEGSLAAFLFHKDFRDYFERTGWSVFARIDPLAAPIRLTLAYIDEDHGLAGADSPWSLRANQDPWRPQPLVGRGRLHSLEGSATLDTRNDREEPTDGWWIEARTKLGVGGDLVLPEHTIPFSASTPMDPAPEIVPERAVDATFGTAFLDARRYNRVGPGSELVVRTVLGGSLTDDALPPQLQHAPGGEGSLPAFSLLSVDCGARRTVAGLVRGEETADPEPVFPAFGCDRMALFQAEFRTDLGWAWSPGADGGAGWSRQSGEWQSDLQLRPRLAAFINAGRGWALSDRPDAFRFDEETRLDVGLGLQVQNAGLYFAFPLSGANDRFNVFLRLDRRF